MLLLTLVIYAVILGRCGTWRGFPPPVDRPVRSTAAIAVAGRALFAATIAAEGLSTEGMRPVRLIGLGVTNLVEDARHSTSVTPMRPRAPRACCGTRGWTARWTASARASARRR